METLAARAAETLRGHHRASAQGVALDRRDGRNRRELRSGGIAGRLPSGRRRALPQARSLQGRRRPSRARPGERGDQAESLPGRAQEKHCAAREGRGTGTLQIRHGRGQARSGEAVALAETSLGQNTWSAKKSRRESISKKSHSSSSPLSGTWRRSEAVRATCSYCATRSRRSRTSSIRPYAAITG